MTRPILRETAWVLAIAVVIYFGVLFLNDLGAGTPPKMTGRPHIATEAPLYPQDDSREPLP